MPDRDAFDICNLCVHDSPCVDGMVASATADGISLVRCPLRHCLVTANAFIGVTGVLAFVLLLIRSKTEEAFLVERFGDDYRRELAR